MEGQKIKAVAFDLGGVILINDNKDILNRIANLIGVSVPEFKRSYWEHNHLSNVQNMPWEDMATEIGYVPILFKNN